MRNNWNEEAYKAKINELYNGKIKVVGHYKNTSHPVLLETPYGIVQYKKAIEALYYEPTIKRALNKTEYFMNELKEIHPEIHKLLEPASEYEAAKKKMLFKTKFGLVSQTPDNLIHGHVPNIRSAIDRKEYFKTQLLFLYDNKYDFIVNSTNRHEGRITLICPIHGEVSVDNDAIFTGMGCPKCNTDNAIPNLFYLIRLYDENESFYKLGISHKVRNGQISRFASYKKLGYNVEVIKIIEFKDAFDCKEFETIQKRIIKPNLYMPKRWEYEVSTETFTNDLLNIIQNNINNLEYDIVSTSDESQSSCLDSGQEITNPNEDI